MNRELRKLGVEDGPRVGTRVERAEEGRYEGEEGVGGIGGGLKSCLNAWKSTRSRLECASPKGFDELSRWLSAPRNP